MFVEIRKWRGGLINFFPFSCGRVKLGIVFVCYFVSNSIWTDSLGHIDN